MNARVEAAVAKGFAFGMFQHEGEVGPFASWLAERNLVNVLEIGTLHGGTAAMFHELCSGVVVSVDLPGGRFGGADHGLDEARCIERGDRLSRELPRFIPVLGDSKSDLVEDLVRYALRDEPVDLLFIDADHSYDGVRADYERYSKLVASGGVVAFHDINDTPLHRRVGCRVDLLWNEIAPKASLRVEFNVHADWGGIGAVIR